MLTEFNSSNTDLLTVEQVVEKLLALDYIRRELARDGMNHGDTAC